MLTLRPSTKIQLPMLGYYAFSISRRDSTRTIKCLMSSSLEMAKRDGLTRTSSLSRSRRASAYPERSHPAGPARIGLDFSSFAPTLNLVKFCVKWACYHRVISHRQYERSMSVVPGP